MLWLEGFLGFEPRVAESQLLKARLCTGTLVKPLCLRGNAGAVLRDETRAFYVS
jgi:hypothetical protein